jgi:hypothetical protein
MGDLNDLPGFTATPTSEQRPADAVYRPMALLAIIGFAVSCLYAAFLLICILVALFSRSAPLMANATLLLPLVGIGLSLAGWIQVRRAEGTLAGGKLAVWGAGLGTVCGLIYVAYAAASYVAVRQQADAEAQKWLGFIRKQDYARAFLLMLPPDVRPADDDKLRDELEKRFNNPERSGKGAFSTFRQQEYCQFLGRGGAESKIESLGVKDWGQQAGGYKVVLSYHLTTPEAACDLDVTMLAYESHKRGARQWVVMRDGTGVQGPVQVTPFGQRVLDLYRQAMPMAMGWFRNLATGQTPAAYVDTLEPARRQQLITEVEARQALTDLTALPCLDQGGPNLTPGQTARLFLPGFRQFLKGDWLRDDPETFWAQEPARTEFPEAVRKTLREDNPRMPLLFRWQDVSAVGWSKVDGRLELQCGCPLTVNDDQGEAKYLGETRLILATDAKVLEPDGSPGPWQVVRLELLRAGSPPGPRRPQ